MLFTAIAATVVILPWAADTATGHREQPARPGDTQLAQQPLVGLGGGVTVREISQTTAFSMVALTGGDLTGTSARIRARHADGSWGPWYETETLFTPGGRGSPPGPHGTDFHRTLSAYLNEVIRAGCILTEITEPTVPPGQESLTGPAAQHVPNFIVIAARRP